MSEIIVAEIWKPVVGYEDWYSVSNFGRVRRDAPASGTWVGNIRTNCIGIGHYEHLILCNAKQKIQRAFYVHRLVAEAFLGRCPAGKQVNHKNGNRLDNRPENLEYLTSRENINHAIRIGTNKSKGATNGSAKLTEAEVIEIRRHLKNGGTTQRVLAAEYKISEAIISQIKHRRRWTHC